MTLVQYILSSLTRYGLQWAFALAPLPAYLPQYWALCKSSQDPILQSKVPKNLGGGVAVGMKRQPSFNGGISSCYAECGGSSSSSISVCTTNSNNTPSVNTNNNNNKSGSNASSSSATTSSGEGGFSPVAILILLLSHTLRLLYCCGSAIVVPIPPRSVDEVRLDLVMQSMVMIGVQLFLLSAVTRSRRSAFKKAIPLSPLNNSTNSNSNSNGNSTRNTLSTNNTTTDNKYFFSDPTTTPTTTTTSLPTDTTKQRHSHISQRPFRWLNQPSQYWNWHSLRQHIEFLLLLTISTSGFCRLYLYPHDSIRCVAMFRNISVSLESCLAVPQLLLNYRRKDTTGLSLAMVLGWFTGDLLKMGYFVLLGDGGTTNGGSGNTTAGSAVFKLGAVFAMGIDLVVVMQIMYWYPSWEVRELRKRLWFWNKGRKDLNKPLLSSVGQDKYPLGML